MKATESSGQTCKPGTDVPPAGNRSSHYLTMRDGVRIAIDVHLPDASNRPLATILHQTRYFRGVQVRQRLFRRLSNALEPAHHTRSRFLKAGYAWVDVDVRGSGASFGQRPCPWSPDEVADGAEIVDWIVGQSWSNGAVGATGVSYAGTTADMLLTCGHPAVKAIAPRFSLFDIYTDVMSPGGVPLRWFMDAWNRVNKSLDANAYDVTVAIAARLIVQGLGDSWMDQRTPWWTRFIRRFDRPRMERNVGRAMRFMGAGVRPVSGDEEALEQAVEGHAENYDVNEEAGRITFRDDILPDATRFDHLESVSHIEGSVGRFSPHSYLESLRSSGAAVLSISGWLDGAYQHSAIKRFLSVPNPGSYLLLGPWEHGGHLHVSPHGRSLEAAFDQEAAMIAFFDHHLLGAPPPDWEPVRYFTMGAEQWRGSKTWPPAGSVEKRWHLQPAGRMSCSAVAEASEEEMALPDDATTGRSSRWRTYLGPHRFIGYPHRARQTRDLPTWRSEPLEEALDVTGHPLVTLWLAARRDDGDLFVYLEAEDADGRIHYVTEGMLRVKHRALHEGPAPYVTPAPYRHFHGDDAAPMPVGKHERVVVDLLPVSYRFTAGTRIRVVLAGADRDNFGAPLSLGEITLRYGGIEPSALILPTLPAD